MPNARQSVTGGELMAHVPEGWGPILNSIGSAYLPYLCANAKAWNTGHGDVGVDIQAAPYWNIRTAPSGIWCPEELRRCCEELSEPQQEEQPVSGVNADRKVALAGGGTIAVIRLKQATKIFWLPVFTPETKKIRIQICQIQNAFS